MVVQYSTAISDLALAGAALYGAIKAAKWSNIPAALGFYLVSMAAVFGVLKFGMVFPGHHNFITLAHKNCIFAATAIGVPLIARTYWHYIGSLTLTNVLSLCCIGISTASFFSFLPRETVATTFSSISVVSIIALSYWSERYYSLLAGVLIALSGLVGSEGTSKMGMLNVDVFHYLFAAAMVFLGQNSWVIT